MLTRLKMKKRCFRALGFDSNNWDPGIQMGFRGINLICVAKWQGECLAKNSFRRANFVLTSKAFPNCSIMIVPVVRSVFIMVVVSMLMSFRQQSMWIKMQQGITRHSSNCKGHQKLYQMFVKWLVFFSHKERSHCNS